MADLVADDRTDGTVIARVVGRHVKKRRLQDGGRENDLVQRRVVVGVDCLRCHAPFTAINRPPGLGRQALPFEACRSLHITQRITGQDGPPAVITPMVRVANLGGVLAQLVLRQRLGLRRHPRQAGDRRPESRQQILHQQLHARLVLGREVPRHIELAHRLAKGPVQRGDGLLPTRQLGGGPRQRTASEGEMGCAESLGQKRCRLIEQVQLEVQLPVGQRDLLKQAGHADDGAGLRN